MRPRCCSIVSGTHGVEGFTGSALQHHWWDHHHADRPDALRVVHLHAFNPHGFSWVRRVNEDNVDLNRNFIDWSQPPPANEDYGGIAQLLVPDAWDDDTQESTLLALLAYADEVGFDRLQEIVSGGQYTHPTGRLLRRCRPGVVASLVARTPPRPRGKRRTRRHRRPAHRARAVGPRRADLPRGSRRRRLRPRGRLVG